MDLEKHIEEIHSQNDAPMEIDIQDPICNIEESENIEKQSKAKARKLSINKPLECHKCG